MSISVLILTLNEELNLPRALDSLRTWCHDVVVLDSYSTDATERIAKEAGARFIQRKFDDYASQRNFGLNEIPYKNDWVFMLDADEVVPSELVEEIRDVTLNGDPDTYLYRLRIKYYLMGRWIRRSSAYPTWFGRLAKLGHVRVDRRINEHLHTDGNVGLLHNHLLHFPFNKGFHAWVEKHNRYSTMEAEEMALRSPERIEWLAFFDKDPAKRRRAAKTILYRLPGRPVVVFLLLYFFRMGFLDGFPGLTFCILRSFYEYMIQCKIKELSYRKKGLPL